MKKEDRKYIILQVANRLPDNFTSPMYTQMFSSDGSYVVNDDEYIGTINGKDVLMRPPVGEEYDHQYDEYWMWYVSKHMHMLDKSWFKKTGDDSVCNWYCEKRIKETQEQSKKGNGEDNDMSVYSQYLYDKMFTTKELQVHATNGFWTICIVAGMILTTCFYIDFRNSWNDNILATGYLISVILLPLICFGISDHYVKTTKEKEKVK